MRPIAKEVASEFLLTSTKGWLGLSLSSHIARVMPAFVFFLIAIGVACAGQNNALVSLISRARVALGPGFGQVHALHVTGKMRTAVASGTFEWWADLTTGEFAVSKSVGPLMHSYGYDGRAAWRKDSKGIVLVQNGPAAVTWNANSEFEEKYALFSPITAELRLLILECAGPKGSRTKLSQLCHRMDIGRNGGSTLLPACLCEELRSGGGT
jgi:hypothetical protein